MSTNRLEKLIEEYRRLAESHPHGASFEESLLLDEARSELEAIRKAAKDIEVWLSSEDRGRDARLMRARAADRAFDLFSVIAKESGS